MTHDKLIPMKPHISKAFTSPDTNSIRTNRNTPPPHWIYGNEKQSQECNRNSEKYRDKIPQRVCGLIEAANQEFPAVPRNQFTFHDGRGRYLVVCLETSRSLFPSPTPADSTVSVTNIVDSRKPRVSPETRPIPPSKPEKIHRGDRVAL